MIESKYMNPWVKYLVTTEYASQDRNGNFTFGGVFTNVGIGPDKSFSLSFSIAGRIENVEDAIHSLKIVVLRPDDTELTQVVAEKKQISGGAINFSFRFNLIEFTQIGMHKIKVYLDGRELINPQGEWVIEVTKNVPSIF